MQSVNRFAIALPFLLVGCGFLPPLPDVKTDGLPDVVKRQLIEAKTKLDQSPKDAAAAGRLGMLLHVYGQREGAIAGYRRAARLDRKAAEWPYYEGVLLQVENKHQEAAAAFRESLDSDSAYDVAKLRLADSLRQSAQPAEAAKLYQELIKANRHEARSHYGLGKLREAEAKLDEAISHYSQACGFYQNYGAARSALAELHKKKGNAAAASEHEAMAKRMPRNEPPLEDTRMLIVLDQDVGPDGQMRRARAFFARNRLAQAVAGYQGALRADPKSAGAHAELISVYARLKSKEQAEEHYRKAIELNPNMWEAHYNYALFQVSREEEGEAARAFEKAIASDPRQVMPHAMYADLLVRRKKHEEAEGHYRKALEINPDLISANRGLGLLLEKDGNCKEAVPFLLKGKAGRNDDSARASYALALCYGKLKEPARKREYLEEARATALLYGPKSLVATIERELRD